MSEQMTFEELDRQLGRAYARTRETRETGAMTLWIWMLRDIASRVAERYRQRDKELYEQLMLLEEEVEAGRDSAVILERIGRAKGFLTVLFLALVLHSVWLGVARGGDGMRRPPSGVRVVRKEACYG